MQSRQPHPTLSGRNSALSETAIVRMPTNVLAVGHGCARAAALGEGGGGKVFAGRRYRGEPRPIQAPLLPFIRKYVVK